jgi:pyruvate kinase
MLTGRPDALLDEMLHLRHEVLREGRELFDEWRPHISRRAFVLSAYNLANYLALRRRDLRALQLELARWGLSSLGRSEARVKPNLDAVTATLGAICHSESPDLPRHPRAWLHDRESRLLTRGTQLLFGPMPTPRDTRIMVTLPPEAATDPTLAQALVQRHVESVRINCAHDTADA